MHSKAPRGPATPPIVRCKAIPRMSRRVSRGGTVGLRSLPSHLGGQKICCRGGREEPWGEPRAGEMTEPQHLGVTSF